MKAVLYILIFISSMLSFFYSVQAGFFDEYINSSSLNIYLCSEEGQCGLIEGIQNIKNSLSGIETQRNFSQYVQDVLQYLLSFVSLLAVLYIMYAGFQILTANGDEGKLKKSKQMILYVAIGIALIWLAWPITYFIFTVLGA